MLGVFVNKRRLVNMSFASWLRRAFTSILLCGLIWEWFRPIVIISDVTQVYILEPFALALILMIAVVYAPLRLVPTLLLHVVIAVSLVAFYFDQTHVWDGQWWIETRQIVSRDLIHFQTLHWSQISGQTRTFAFLWLWSLAAIWIYRLVIDYRYAEWFVALSIGYLLLLEYVFDVESKQAVARVLLLGFALLICQRIGRWWYELQEESEGQMRLKISRGVYARSVPVFALIVLIVGGAWWLAGQMSSKQMEGETANSRKFGWFAAASSSSSTGYSEREQRLGGPVRPDDALVFTAQTEKLTYWKAEHRLTYTGSSWRPERGRWIAVNGLAEASTQAQPMKLDADRADAIPVQTMSQFVKPAARAIEQEQILFYGGTRVVGISGQGKSGQVLNDDKLYLDRSAMRYRLTDSGAPLHYTMEVVVAPDPLAVDPKLGAAWASKSLQLPEGLPARVGELAVRLTEDADGALDKATRISRYLSDRYAYTMSDVAYPPDDADFVDFFLFEQLRGYCDHFSSALAVMLRTVGVPTRWVSGYSPGEIRSAPSAENHYYEVEVRQEHAHSWVEVYSEESGWVIFDPTPSEVVVASAEQPEPIHHSPRIRPLFHDVMAALIILAITTIWAVFTYRMFKDSWYAWCVYRLVNKLPVTEDAQRRAKILEKMWQLIGRRYESRVSGETYREYVRRLIGRYPGKQLALSRFLHDFERIQYGGFQLTVGGRRAIRNRWIRCVKR